MKVNRQLKQMIVLLILVTAASTVALASVFVYNPLTVNINPVSPPVIFDLGSNANQADLAGNTIEVTLGADQASATVTIHPTFQTTYYKNITLIKNTDTTTYYVWIRVESAASLPAGSTARMILKDLSGSTTYATIDLLSTGTSSYITLNGGQALRADFEIYIEEGTTPSTTSATLKVIYSTSTESPP